MARLPLALFFLFSVVLPCSAAEPAPAIAIHPLVTGFDRPVQVVSAHDHSGDLYVAQQSGAILRLHDGQKSTFLDLTSVISCCSNGGVLSVVFHPDYLSNGFLYVQYVDRNGDTAIARYSRSTDGLRGDPASAMLLLVVDQPSDNVPNHHGGTLLFGPDGMLYVSIGDGGAYVRVTERAQDLTQLLGKILRLDVDHAPPYTIPGDNPFVGNPTARGEIWSYGLRNPWRMSFDRLTGELLLGDVGQDSFEEIDMNTIAAARGANFGWPVMEGAHCFPPGTSRCETRGLTMPIAEYPRASGCSVTGGYRYRGRRWSRFHGVYLFGDFCSGTIWGIAEDDAQHTVRPLLSTTASIVSFGEDDDGELYLVDYKGAIFSITDPASDRRRTVRR